jgi:tRNA A37 threonylcarbamoyladenosine dehydratase
MMLGAEAVDKLKGAHVAVFGIGGVGGYAAEAIARAGIGKITLIDPDAVSVSNLNRQIIALRSTVGKNKAEAMKERIADINPDCTVTALPIFYGEETKDEIDFRDFDFVVDAIDTVKSKLLIIKRAKENGIPVISSMGAGNKLDPTRFRVTDIFKTSHDPLARAVRSELCKLGIASLKVVYSDEEPTGERAVRAPGSISFVPGAAGLALASEVILDLVRGQ